MVFGVLGPLPGCDPSRAFLVGFEAREEDRYGCAAEEEADGDGEGDAEAKRPRALGFERSTIAEDVETLDEEPFFTAGLALVRVVAGTTTSTRDSAGAFLEEEEADPSCSIVAVLPFPFAIVPLPFGPAALLREKALATSFTALGALLETTIQSATSSPFSRVSSVVLVLALLEDLKASSSSESDGTGLARVVVFVVFVFVAFLPYCMTGDGILLLLAAIAHMNIEIPEHPGQQSYGHEIARVDSNQSRFVKKSIST